MIALGEKATPGPWKAVDADCNQREFDSGPNKNWVWRDGHSPFYDAVCECNCDDSGGTSERERTDASFIALSRNLTPAVMQGFLIALEALEKMANDPSHNGHLCENDEMGCQACELAQETLARIINQK